MRLGDLDALKKHKFTTQIRNGVAIGEIEVVPVAEIDNAPTIKTFTLLDIEEQYRKGLEKGLSEWETERPQGEWIEVKPHQSDLENGIDYRVECSVCHEKNSYFRFDEFSRISEEVFVSSKFCPNCGAEMKKGENNGSD